MRPLKNFETGIYYKNYARINYIYLKNKLCQLKNKV